VVGHRMPFHQVDPPLTAQLPQDPADLPVSVTLVGSTGDQS
jgi:hypothetical protein